MCGTGGGVYRGGGGGGGRLLVVTPNKSKMVSSRHRLVVGYSVFICFRRGAVVKRVEHISTIVLVNTGVARVRVPLVLLVGI